MEITKAPCVDYLAFDTLRALVTIYRVWLEWDDTEMADATYILWAIMAPHCFVRYYKEY